MLKRFNQTRFIFAMTTLRRLLYGMLAAALIPGGQLARRRVSRARFSW